MAQPTQPMRSTLLIVDDESGPRESLHMILAPHYRVLQLAVTARPEESPSTSWAGIDPSRADRR